MFTFLFNEQFYTSNHSDFPSSLPFWSSLPDNPSPQQLKDRLWYSSQHPYLPFVLKSPFHGDLLRRLSVPVDRIEVVLDTHDWHLPRQVAKDWKALEHVLVLATKNLLSFFRQNHPKTHLVFTSPELPSTYGFFDTHKSEAAARSALSVSLDAFAIYLGYFSFIVAICEFGIDRRSSPPSWHRRLARSDSPVHPEWLKLLLDSPIVDFKRERIGVVADVARCQWLHLAKYMVQASIPIWFYWGKSPFYVTPLESWIRDEYYLGDDDPLTVAPTDATGRALPSVIPQSGQRPGETMEQFFSRRRQRNEKLKEKESDRERSSRQAREKSHASRPIPGKKGPTVFYWDDVEGFRIRTPLPRFQVDGMWGRWKSTEKVYDGFNNSWDCCSLFGDSIPGEPDLDSDDDHDDIYPMVNPQPPPTAPDQQAMPPTVNPQPPPTAPDQQVMASTIQSVEQSQSEPATIRSVEQSAPDTSSMSRRGSPNNRSPLRDIHTPTVHHEAPDPALSTLVLPTPADRGVLPQRDEIIEDEEREDLFDASSKDVLAANLFHCVTFASSLAQTVDDLVYYRFGFSLNEHPYSGVPSDITPVAFRTFQEVVRAVGGQHMQFSGTNERVITDFLGCLLSTRNPLRDVPGKYWDLSSMGADPLTQSTTNFICIERRVFEDRARYLLRPINLHPSRDTSWVLAVDAMTALECIRRGLGPHTLDIANYFIDHGIPFSTISYLQPSSQGLKREPRLVGGLLGRRPKGYTFNLADYAAYTTIRDSYLLSHSNARAALCAGGIVARLAREEMSNVAVLSGPSEAALNGEQTVFTSGDDRFCDDMIPPEVIDLICGVYEVETGQKGEMICIFYLLSLNQIFLDEVALVSWFPRQNNWNVSGLNVGQWTHECEEWYVKRVNTIQEGGAPLKQHEWRNVTRFTRKGPKLVYHMNLAASSYIQENM